MLPLVSVALPGDRLNPVRAAVALVTAHVPVGPALLVAVTVATTDPAVACTPPELVTVILPVPSDDVHVRLPVAIDPLNWSNIDGVNEWTRLSLIVSDAGLSVS